MKHNGVDSIRLCVIIPTYNNAGTIRQVISDVAGYCQDVIVVNDGSTDDTATILDCLSIPITLVSYPKNKGKGHALVKGFLKAKELGFTHAITIDADGQHFPEDIPLFIKEIKENPEGTRSKDCKLGLFQRGAFYLAEQLKLDILPVFIKGFGKVLPKKSYHLRPGKMTLEVKPRIYRDQLTTEENYRELCRRMRRQYQKWNHEEVKLYKHNH